MPYSIKTYEPGGSLDPIGAGQDPDRVYIVRTLDAARYYVRNTIERACLDPRHESTDAIGKTGGTVGPFSDGLTIEVDWLSDERLCKWFLGTFATSELVDALNERLAF